MVATMRASFGHQLPKEQMPGHPGGGGAGEPSSPHRHTSANLAPITGREGKELERCWEG